MTYLCFVYQPINIYYVPKSAILETLVVCPFVITLRLSDIRNYSRLIHSFLNDANHLEIKCNQTCQECYFCVPVVHSENEMATTTRHRLTLEPL
jgi:hypothetical protein